MKQVILYTGNGVTLSPVFADGRTESNYVRLIADEGQAITNGEVVTGCVDVPKADIGKWRDCAPADEAEELTAEEALSIIMGGSE